MKKLFTLLCGLIANLSWAQITITNTDLASANDTVRFSEASALTPVDLSLTGANYTWDFSGLQSVSQDVDSFLSVSSTPLVYFLFFGFSSNLASRGVDLSSFPGVPISDVYSFFNKSSNNYKQTGYGASINGITTPIAFNNDDIVYDFPVNFGNVDSSDSDYSISLPGLATAIGSQHRVNVVDGWGSITTPYGTFNALRIVSTLTGEDSVYLDTLGFGFSSPRPLTREYKWLADAQDIPVLQINTIETLGIETVSLIKYRDSLRTPVGLPANYLSHTPMTLAPNPSKGSDVLAVINLKNAASLEVSIYSAEGRLVDRRQVQLQAGKQTVAVRPSDLQLNAGVYLVEMSSLGERFSARMVIQP
ncbi:MAG: T9SS type A sorting domain-containing protein [Bacteroidia bacterium]|nr:T9SS type A sorting domain-containing protein [Bacteroidia bacterium]